MQIAMRKLILGIIILFLAGCSSREWMARFYIVRAEAALDKARELKSKHVDYEKRVGYFQEGCDLFFRAYKISENAFTLVRIEMAADACWKANDMEKQESFRLFEEQYSKSHPQETEYGDAGVGMIDMGG